MALVYLPYFNPSTYFQAGMLPFPNNNFGNGPKNSQPCTRYQPRQQNQPSQAFKGSCTVCKQIRHKGRDCPKLGDRKDCFVCGKLDVIYPECDFCQTRKAQQGKDNAETRTSPPVPRQQENLAPWTLVL